MPDYVSDCYLCPGNVRVNGKHNDNYASTFVFDNDMPSVSLEAPQDLAPPVGIYRNRSAQGVARVVCYSPHHSLTLAELEPSEVEELLSVWQEQYRELGSRPEVKHVLIFENKGEAVGVSNPHPHCQIYATNFVFKFIETEARASARHLRDGPVLFQDILLAEQLDGRRIICENETAIAFMPYFARYAYEVFVAPKQTHPHIAALTDRERRDLADVLRRVLIKFDNLWQLPFPYVMPLHQAPTDGGDYSGFHFHINFIHRCDDQICSSTWLVRDWWWQFLSDTAPKKAAELRKRVMFTTKLTGITHLINSYLRPRPCPLERPLLVLRRADNKETRDFSALTSASSASLRWPPIYITQPQRR